MAGSGRKVFAPGEVLTATNVQNYLMDQAVQVYADSVSRGSAIGSATTDGMVSWLSDVNNMQVATGTATWQDVSLVETPNAIINGAFDIWQRDTSSTTAGYTTADRWRSAWNGTGVRTISRQSFALGAAPVAGYEYSYFYRFAQSTAGTGGTFNNFAVQPIESVRTFAGQVVTVSFWAKADATRSVIPIFEQYFGTGGSPSAVVTSTGSGISVTTSWARYSQTFTLTSISGKTIGTSGTDALIFTLQSALNNATHTIDIFGVQIEGGYVATPFRRHAPSLQGELAACQRYYYRRTAAASDGALATGFSSSGTAANVLVTFPVEMRATPSTTLDWTGTNANYKILFASTAVGINATPTLDANSGPSGVRVFVTSAASGLTTGQGVMLSSNVAGAYLGFSAEL
jgi:hypothetical protein